MTVIESERGTYPTVDTLPEDLHRDSRVKVGAQMNDGVSARAELLLWKPDTIQRSDDLVVWKRENISRTSLGLFHGALQKLSLRAFSNPRPVESLPQH